MAIDSELKNYLKAIRVEHDERIDDTYMRKGTMPEYAVATSLQSGLMSAADKQKLDGINPGATDFTLPTATADSLGGVLVDGQHGIGIDSSGKIYIKRGDGIDYDADGYLNVITADGLTVDEFSHKVKVVPATADSIGGVKITGNDGLLITSSGVLKVADSLQSGGITNPISANLTLTGGLTAKSITADFTGATITLSSATSIKGNPQVTGNPTFSGDPVFSGDVEFNDDVYFYAASIGHNVGDITKGAKVHMNQASINASGTTVNGGVEFTGNPTLSGNPVFTGNAKFNGKIYMHTSEVEDENTTVNGAKIYMQDSTVNAARCSISGNPTISGNPRFTGNPHLDGDIYLNRTVDGGNKYAKVYADNATIYGSPVFTGNPSLSGNPTLSGNPVFTGNPTFEFISGFLYFKNLNGKVYRVKCTETLDFRRLHFMGYVKKDDIPQSWFNGNSINGDHISWCYDSLEDIDVTTPHEISGQAGMCIALVSEKTEETQGYYQWQDSDGWVYVGTETSYSWVEGPFTSLEDSALECFANSNFSGVILIQDNSSDEFNINYYIYAPANDANPRNTQYSWRPFTNPKFDPRTLPRFNVIGQCFRMDSLNNPRVLMSDGYVNANVGDVIFIVNPASCGISDYDFYLVWTGANWELFNTISREG